MYTYIHICKHLDHVFPFPNVSQIVPMSQSHKFIFFLSVCLSFSLCLKNKRKIKPPRKSNINKQTTKQKITKDKQQETSKEASTKHNEKKPKKPKNQKPKTVSPFLPKFQSLFCGDSSSLVYEAH